MLKFLVPKDAIEETIDCRSRFFVLNVGGLFFLVLASLYLNFFHHRMDIYPFYRWDMFVGSTREITDFSVNVDQVDGISQNRDFYHNREEYMGRSDRQIYYTIERLGWHAFENESAEFKVKEKSFMDNAFPNRNKVDYTLYQRQIDVVEYLKNRKPISTKFITRRRCEKLNSHFICTTLPRVD